MKGRLTQGVVELAAASLPWAIRDRYREEWLHDLAHAAEVGVHPRDVAWGAVRTAITADRMQAPSTAHAILQARLRIDSAGTHGTIAMTQLVIMFVTGAGAGSGMGVGVGAPTVVGVLLALTALIHSVFIVVQLHLAWTVIGGAIRFAALLWGLGIVLALAAALLALNRVDQWWMLSWGAGACLAASSILADARKPPKPVLRHHVRPGSRYRLVLAGGAVGVLTIALAVLDATALVPQRWAAAMPLDAAWAAVGASGGPSSPLAAGAQLAALMLVPIVLCLFVAGRWARSERGILGWVSSGSLLAAFVAFFHATALTLGLPVTTSTPVYVILPLVAGALMELVYRGLPRLAALPPASVPLPPGPWHVELDVPSRGRVTG
ncbi:hypothetical protein [Agrococcus sp. KRD186]|uniref:hypothetical protein n=1 Tax=Agrococcus sp. KRD186 TaxID=2729730 RepID=UPI0019D1AA81|nr:hypothetical protein [Agrococcus sp. KRD186]